MPHRLAVLLALALGAACGRGADAPGRDTSSSDTTAARDSVIPLRSGRAAVDLLGTGAPGEIIVARRDNFNAHGYSTVMFLVRVPNAESDHAADSTWLVLPFFGGDGDGASGREVVRTSEGADCTLRDLRVFRRQPGRPVDVVIATRALGESFAAPAAVRFEFYALRKNEEGTVGNPTWYFERVRTTPAKRTYCDVDDAFDRELGLGRAGVLTWDGPR